MQGLALDLGLGPAPALPPEEYAARRARVAEAMGPDAVAVLQGAPAPSGFHVFRQTNEFYYLSGATEPHAYLLLDGQSGGATLYLPRERPRAPGDPERIAPLDRLGHDLARVLAHRPALAVFTPLGPAEGAGETRDTLLAAAAESAADPWDGAPTREARFAEALQRRFPQLRTRLHDLSPVLDRLRLVKSPAEVAMLRRAARLCGLGLMEAMRATRAGAVERDLEAVARLVFRLGGAQGDGYCAIVASGPNVWDAHYHANDRTLEDGELVLMDYAPDCDYYTSDIGRMWPVGGTYAPWQRELYGFVVAYHEALLRRLRPGVTAAQVLAEAAADMRARAEGAFGRDSHAAAARRALDFEGHLSHPVGMAVHDVGDYRGAPLRPGLVLAVDPQVWVPEERLYVRVEDTVALTADGVENLTGFVPRSPEAIERHLREPGMRR